MRQFLWVCLGGAVGTGARYLVQAGALRWLGPTFPWGTLSVNLVGSFLIAAIMHLGLVGNAIPPALRITLTAGVMGGLTTYSSFSYETWMLAERGSWGLAALNLTATTVGCLLACVAGLGTARWAVGA